MSSLPRICLVDTNVPIVANYATQSALPTDVPLHCMMACVQAIKHITTNGSVVLDAGGEILAEYNRHLSRSGQGGQGDKFFKWLHNNSGYSHKVQWIPTTKLEDNTYAEFPDHPDLTEFDPSDRKFVATANAHPDKPPILQAVDHKWWGWRTALSEEGISVHFLCEDYVQAKSENNEE